MKRIAIVGTQWGDEGKGKIANYFSSHFDWVVRYSGGANAGHTVYVDGIPYVNHLLPSVEPSGHSKAFLGSSMVLDLEQLIEEIKAMERTGPGLASRVYLDPEVFLVLPWHKQEDALLETRTDKPLGTTRRGIGPAYTDKVSRKGLKLYSLFDEQMLSEGLERLYEEKRSRYGEDITGGPVQTHETLLELREELISLGVNFATSLDLSEQLRNDSILFEGAQGVLLDLDFGTYPYVTSSSCLAQVIASSGFSVSELDEVFGVVKAYATRVGTGPFPTEEEGNVSSEIREKGREYGATTGRPRRIGWLDLPALRYACEKSAITSLIMTKVDVLFGIDEIKVCTGYRINGRISDIPASSYDFFKAEPVYNSLPSWKSTGDTSFSRFLEFVERTVGRRIAYISHGPETNQILQRNELSKG